MIASGIRLLIDIFIRKIDALIKYVIKMQSGARMQSEADLSASKS